MDLLEDSTQGWQWFCLSNRFDSCAALLSLLSLNMSSLTSLLCVCALIERTDRSVPSTTWVYVPNYIFVYAYMLLAMSQD